MAVSLTEQQVRDRIKFVTRRVGWNALKVGDHLQLCRKVMGRRRPDGTVEPLVRIVEVVVTSVTREPLNAITADEVALEGFPGATPEWFVEFFIESHRQTTPDTLVTRIAWEYVD